MRPPRGSRPQPNLGPGGPFSRLDACPALQRRGMLLYVVFDACRAEVQGFGRIFRTGSPKAGAAGPQKLAVRRRSSEGARLPEPGSSVMSTPS
jgi:hypothetical protein